MSPKPKTRFPRGGPGTRRLTRLGSPASLHHEPQAHRNPTRRRLADPCPLASPLIEPKHCEVATVLVADEDEIASWVDDEIARHLHRVAVIADASQLPFRFIKREDGDRIVRAVGAENPLAAWMHHNLGGREAF